MSDIISLLPDSVANQIAAGEVVQRPASVVKELMENAIDAGSTSIQLIIKDAGKTMIRVLDNGCGMSETDARLSFERHATSKIKLASDLFDLHTKGFRGEALASIGAIAHVELKTKLAEDPIGTKIVMEGSEVKSQEACQCSAGTSFSVKNLFYNVPARRNFLKSDGVESKHIIEEFQRIALAHPDISMSFHHNETEVFNLPAAGLRQRIVNIFGSKYNQRLVPLDESTDIVSLSGYVGKPEFAKKSRGEQYLFVNNRFIKSNYLNHAITSAFDELLQAKHHPMYFVFLEVNPSTVDVNIHPTKTEVKFQDERAIYAILHSTVKRSLGRFNISPSLDFDQESSITVSTLDPNAPLRTPEIRVDTSFNPFEAEKKGRSGLAGSFGGESVPSNWKSLFEGTQEIQIPVQQKMDIEKQSTDHGNKLFQLQGKYIITQTMSGMIVIDQRRAHIRVLFERFLEELKSDIHNSQQLLFPQTITLNPSEASIINTRIEEIKSLGFDLEVFGPNSFKLNGIPSNLTHDDPIEMIEDFISQIQLFVDDIKFDHHQQMALSLARSASIKTGDLLNVSEMQHLVDELFACGNPHYTPKGKPTIVTFNLAELDEKFDK